MSCRIHLLGTAKRVKPTDVAQDARDNATLKHGELANHVHKKKGVSGVAVRRCQIVFWVFKLFTEQGASASQVAATRFLRTISHIIRSKRRSLSARTSLHKGRTLHSKYTYQRKKFGYYYLDVADHKDGTTIRSLSYRSNAPCTAIRWQDSYGEEDWNNFGDRRWEEVQRCDCQKGKLGSDVEKLRKHIDLDEPTPFWDKVYLGCTQRAASNDQP